MLTELNLRQKYFIAFGYKPNEKHDIQFTLQELLNGTTKEVLLTHYQIILNMVKWRAKYKIQLWLGYKMEKSTHCRNFYHKPVASINWDFKLVIKQHCHLFLRFLGTWWRNWKYR
jgi:hypothetical protein